MTKILNLVLLHALLHNILLNKHAGQYLNDQFVDANRALLFHLMVYVKMPMNATFSLPVLKCAQTPKEVTNAIVDTNATEETG